MVLITASTVSALLSAGIVSIFTFLLFLAGYVLQQQSVNSLREAIRQPPPPPVVAAKATLPEKSRNGGSDSENGEHQVVVDREGNETDIDSQIAQFLANGNTAEDANTVSTPSNITPPPAEPLAYALALTTPSDLCSASLFASSLDLTPASPERLILLYPSTWETSLTPHHISALQFMRNLHDTYPIIFHPVEIRKGFKGASVTSHLLGEFQRTKWGFGRVLYLKGPGVVVDGRRLRGMVRSESGRGGAEMRRGWTEMTGEVGEDPEVLLCERRRGLLMPRGEMRGLVGREIVGGAGEKVDGSEPAVGLGQREEKAYVVFGSEDATEGSSGKSELQLAFEDRLQMACRGKGLLAGEEDRAELR